MWSESSRPWCDNKLAEARTLLAHAAGRTAVVYDAPDSPGVGLVARRAALADPVSAPAGRGGRTTGRGGKHVQVRRRGEREKAEHRSTGRAGDRPHGQAGRRTGRPVGPHPRPAGHDLRADGHRPHEGPQGRTGRASGSDPEANGQVSAGTDRLKLRPRSCLTVGTAAIASAHHPPSLARPGKQRIHRLGWAVASSPDGRTSAFEGEDARVLHWEQPTVSVGLRVAVLLRATNSVAREPARGGRAERTDPPTPGPAAREGRARPRRRPRAGCAGGTKPSGTEPPRYTRLPD
jgi:hypothetical protein